MPFLRQDDAAAVDSDRESKREREAQRRQDLRRLRQRLWNILFAKNGPGVRDRNKSLNEVISVACERLEQQEAELAQLRREVGQLHQLAQQLRTQLGHQMLLLAHAQQQRSLQLLHLAQQCNLSPSSVPLEDNATDSNGTVTRAAERQPTRKDTAHRPVP
ncbi:MAG: hypothetical protein MHM6MM_003387 [Cercozoa sp. M6MM]